MDLQKFVIMFLSYNNCHLKFGDGVLQLKNYHPRSCSGVGNDFISHTFVKPTFLDRFVGLLGVGIP